MSLEEKVDILEKHVSKLVAIGEHNQERFEILIDILNAQGNIEFDPNEIRDMRIVIAAYQRIIRQILAAVRKEDQDVRERMDKTVQGMKEWTILSEAKEGILERHRKRSKLLQDMQISDDNDTEDDIFEEEPLQPDGVE